MKSKKSKSVINIEPENCFDSMQESRRFSCIEHIGIHHADFIIIFYLNYGNRFEWSFYLTLNSYFSWLFLVQTLKLFNVHFSLELLDLSVLFSEVLNITFWRVSLFLRLFCQLNRLVNLGFFLDFLLNFENHSFISLFFS